VSGVSRVGIGAPRLSSCSAPNPCSSHGPFARTEWVAARTPWLARDLDNSGCIEDQRELFGVAPGDAFANGFEKLALLDANGDGVLDARDPDFASLVMWADANQNRICERSEMRVLRNAGIRELNVRPHAMTGATNIHTGSYEGETTAFEVVSADAGQDPKRLATTPGRLVDVYLTSLR
jgi:hypothetical protein